MRNKQLDIQSIKKLYFRKFWKASEIASNCIDNRGRLAPLLLMIGQENNFLASF